MNGDIAVAQKAEPVKAPITPPLVVLVNNESAILKMTADHLRRTGLRVTTFLSAATAADAPEPAGANLVLTDYTNPPLGGVGLWQALRRRGIATPVAFLSASSEDLEARFAGSADAPVAFFQLPMRFAKLAEQVSALARQDRR
jgi:DNA-binding response OmpR family regulator